MNIATERMGVKLASALLLHYGEVSMEDIRAMPFFASPDESEAVIRYLLATFNVEIYQRRISSYPMLQWEEVIGIRDPMQYQRRVASPTDK